jgi:hypothetical protein
LTTCNAAIGVAAAEELTPRLVASPDSWFKAAATPSSAVRSRLLFIGIGPAAAGIL